MNSSFTTTQRDRAAPWQLALRRFFAQVWVEIAIGLLVIVSVLLTVLEFALESRFAAGASSVESLFGSLTPVHLHRMELINAAITTIFIVELTLRYLAAKSKKRYFQEFWLDIIATLPLFRVFRSARALRLLRLVRLFRLLGVISRLSTHYPYIMRRGAADFLMICSLLLLAVAFGTLAITHFEQGALVSAAVEPGTEIEPVVRGPGDGFGIAESFWFSVYTLFAGEPIPEAPKTLSGKIVTVFLMFMGLTIFAIFAGTVSAFMVDRLRMEGKVVEFDTFQNHIIICGWTPKTEIIIQEYRAGKQTRHTPIIVITELSPEQLEADTRGLAHVHFVHDDFTRHAALERAGVDRAQTCLVLSDTSGGRSEQDADARTILAALTVEKINESVYTCAELFNRSYATHLQLGKVNDYVVSSEYGAHMLAQAAMKRGLISVFGELLTYQRGNEFYRVPIPESWVGTRFGEKLGDAQERHHVILVAVQSPGAEPVVNPERYTFQAGDEVVVIGDALPKLD